MYYTYSQLWGKIETAFNVYHFFLKNACRQRDSSLQGPRFNPKLALLLLLQ